MNISYSSFSLDVVYGLLKFLKDKQGFPPDEMDITLISEPRKEKINSLDFCRNVYGFFSTLLITVDTIKVAFLCKDKRELRKVHSTCSETLKRNYGCCVMLTQVIP